jgi:RimJ/RimL family protein N-acetyltransferase
MDLISVYKRRDAAKILYKLLGERDGGVNISHRMMPSYRAHMKFIRSKPYRAWYLVIVGNVAIGACYLSKQDEIGVGILKEYQGQGYGNEAVRRLMSAHGKRRYLANVNPRNERSARMFKDLGFNLIQHTYEAIA